MYRVLIVEDEVMVRLGIKNAVDWAAYDMQVIADAEDGESGYEAYVRYHPQVVITDLKMNNGSGEELIGKIRTLNDVCVLIVISCVEDFHVLQDLVKQQILGYLSKASMMVSDLTELWPQPNGSWMRKGPAMKQKTCSRTIWHIASQHILWVGTHSFGNPFRRIGHACAGRRRKRCCCISCRRWQTAGAIR